MIRSLAAHLASSIQARLNCIARDPMASDTSTIVRSVAGECAISCRRCQGTGYYDLADWLDSIPTSQYEQRLGDTIAARPDLTRDQCVDALDAVLYSEFCDDSQLRFDADHTCFDQQEQEDED